jgi:hypothetical protein
VPDAVEWPAFFELSGGRYIPLPLALSFWSDKAISGPPVCGMVARELGNKYLSGEFVPARLTVDLSRPVPATPLTVSTRLVRDSRRIRVVDAEVLTANGDPVARANAVFLMRSAQPPGAVWQRQHVPSAPADGDAPGQDVTPVYGSADLWSGDIGAYQNSDRKRVWVRRIAVVDGENPSPFERAAIVGEQASFVTNWGTKGIEFINVDVTLNLARLPVGTELGIEADSHLSDTGIAACAATLYDSAGPVGICTVSALANAQRSLDLAKKG